MTTTPAAAATAGTQPPIPTITTVAGTGSAGYGGDNGPAIAAQLNNPVGVAVDSGAGALYVSERDSHRIRKVTGVAEAVSPVTGAEVTSAKSESRSPS